MAQLAEPASGSLAPAPGFPHSPINTQLRGWGLAQGRGQPGAGASRCPLGRGDQGAAPQRTRAAEKHQVTTGSRWRIGRQELHRRQIFLRPRWRVARLGLASRSLQAGEGPGSRVLDLHSSGLVPPAAWIPIACAGCCFCSTLSLRFPKELRRGHFLGAERSASALCSGWLGCRSHQSRTSFLVTPRPTWPDSHGWCQAKRVCHFFGHSLSNISDSCFLGPLAFRPLPLSPLLVRFPWPH